MPVEPSFGCRDFFPLLRPKVYVNHAAVSPPSVVVVDAVNKVLTDYATWGLEAVFPWADQREELRGDISNLINAKPHEIGFIGNTTTGMIHVATCMQWKKGDRIVLLDGEFPSNVIPWQQAAERFALSIEFLATETFRLQPTQGLAALERFLQQGVRLVAVSAVQFQTGFQMPLESIGFLCRKYNALLFVDGIQACGMVPLDMQKMHIDFLSCGSHKWLMGIEGCGFLFIRDAVLTELFPQTAGWLSPENPFDFLTEGEGLLRYDKPFKSNASFVEGGAVAVAGFAALSASIKTLQKLGVLKIYEHVTSYLDELEAGLLHLGFQSLRRSHGLSGILSVIPPKKLPPSKVTSFFASLGIACSMPDGKLRFSPHWPNSTREIPLIVETCRSLFDK